MVLIAKKWSRPAKIICAFSVLAMIVGASAAVYRAVYLDACILAEATIAKLVETKAENSPPVYSTVYVFADNLGHEVKVVSTSASRPPVGKVGDKIEILYMSKAPEHAIRNQFFTKWGLALATGGPGLLYFLVFATVAHFTDKRIKSEPDAHPATV